MFVYGESLEFVNDLDKNPQIKYCWVIDLFVLVSSELSYMFKW